MKLIVGLGNPGDKYVKTRHNAGFLVVDCLNTKRWTKSKSGLLEYSWLTPAVELVKPQTFMNESGNAVNYAVKKHGIKPDDLYVIHDDLDIKLGEYKIQFGKGPKDHNGVKSVDEALGTDQYWHVRIGVDDRSLDNRIPGEIYVLQDFLDVEKQKLDEEIKRVCKKLATLLKNTN